MQTVNAYEDAAFAALNNMSISAEVSEIAESIGRDFALAGAAVALGVAYYNSGLSGVHDELPGAAGAIAGAEAGALLGVTIAGPPGAALGAIGGGFGGLYAGGKIPYADSNQATINAAMAQYEKQFGYPGENSSAYDANGNPTNYAAFGQYLRNNGAPFSPSTATTIGPMGT